MKSLFLCESCGKQVSYKTPRCPYCGRFFSAVVCPRCLHSGKPEDFLSGCPECGYLSSSSTGLLKKKGKGSGFFLSKKKKKKFELPLWFYKTAGIVVLLVLLAIIAWYVYSMM
jgi:ssDNA-binding Zn-finger/Zn-ribbon topoisomerase 1